MRFWFFCGFAGLLLACGNEAYTATVDPCIAAGTRNGLVTGPTDQDDGGSGDPDKADDACLTLLFNVPAASPDKTDPGGWGGLTLTFNVPIDGGSFIFDPVCPTPQDGTLGQIAPGGGEPTTLPNTSITFKPVVGSKPYYLLPTGSRTDTGGMFGQFAVTIMYDASQGTPQLQANDLVGGPGSYWVGKPGQQNGGFSPYRVSAGPPARLGLDYAPATPVPEPAGLLPLVLGCLVILICAHKRHTVRRS
jgi:hypothetical protein